jgi:hypothetical protein
MITLEQSCGAAPRNALHTAGPDFTPAFFSLTSGLVLALIANGMRVSERAEKEDAVLLSRITQTRENSLRFVDTPKMRKRNSKLLLQKLMAV